MKNPYFRLCDFQVNEGCEDFEQPCETGCQNCEEFYLTCNPTNNKCVKVLEENTGDDYLRRRLFNQD